MISLETLRRLEFDKVLLAVSVGARSEVTANSIMAMVPLEDHRRAAMDMGRIEEIRGLLRQRVTLRISTFDNILPLLEKVRPDGAILPALSLLSFIPVLGSLADLHFQFAPRQDIPLLKLLEPPPEPFGDILEPLAATIDAEGNILDSASAELSAIRKAKRTLAARIRRKLEEIVRQHETAVFLQDDFITIRSGRWVIPVRMDSKGMVQGVVHDVSSSGETAFMEPLEIIPFVNELENLTAGEKAEEIRILRQLSGWIREDAEKISAGFATLVELDRLDCLAGFAERYSMSVPELNNNGKLRLLSARHPILLAMKAQSNESSPAPVVPLDILLSSDEGGARLLVISGPNAGGKTIALKTVGLITAMALSGMPVPASPSSSIPLLDSILVDIGDDQSIEQSLSTFSAHIAAAAGILRQAGSRSLVLLDELGTGTEPLQGAAIGCAVLNELSALGAMVIATTHLTEIVGFVHKSSGMQNAGMEFDSATWTPLYRLVMGEPGQSHALETARRYGLPQSVLEFAKGLLGDAGTAFAGVIEELRQKRNLLDAEILCQQQESSRLDEMASLLEQQRSEIDELRRKALEQGREQARTVVSTARRELNQLIEEFRKERKKETESRLRERISELESAFEPSGSNQLNPATLKPGTAVHLHSLGRSATVVSVDRERCRARVRAGSMEMDVPVNGLGPINAQEARYKGRDEIRNFAAPWIQETVAAATELKIIGKRVDEALTMLEGFIDQAVLSGTREIRVVHGMGTGVLQRAVREFLGRHPQVENFRPGEPHEGRDGATIVFLG